MLVRTERARRASYLQAPPLTQSDLGRAVATRPCATGNPHGRGAVIDDSAYVEESRCALPGHVGELRKMAQMKDGTGESSHRGPADSDFWQ
jgi:hypothetical protein